MGFGADISREFIEVPDSAKGQLLYKWPDHQIRRWSKAIVDIDEMALFVTQGRVVGTMPPGRHNVDASELPFLGDLIDKLSGDKAYDSELFFVNTREFPDLAFGGSVDAVSDPQTHLVVELRAFGELSLHVIDAVAFIRQLTGTVDLADPSAVVHWVAQQVLKAVRTVVVTHVVNDNWPVLGLAARTPEIEAGTLTAANTTLLGYGLEVTRLGNLTVSVSDEDADQLRDLARATAYTTLAGSFGAYASGEALLGAGRGMAEGKGAAGEALAVAGLGIGANVIGGLGGAPGRGGSAGFVAGAALVGGTPAGPSTAGSTPEPGASTSTASVGFCSQCGHALNAGANFCASCGHAVTPQS
ncbi:MAG TPA: SPFH domain-containing protein [Acidothermaceae bacterium]